MAAVAFTAKVATNTNSVKLVALQNIGTTATGDTISMSSGTAYSMSTIVCIFLHGPGGTTWSFTFASNVITSSSLIATGGVGMVVGF